MATAGAYDNDWCPPLPKLPSLSKVMAPRPLSTDRKPTVLRPSALPSSASSSFPFSIPSAAPQPVLTTAPPTVVPSACTSGTPSSSSSTSDVYVTKVEPTLLAPVAAAAPSQKRARNNVVYLCTVCTFEFDEKSELNAHVRTTHGGREKKSGPFKCHQCGHGFTKRGNLNRHILTHANIKRFHCSECPRAFQERHHLEAHKNSHSGARPYQCSNCLVGYADKSNLRRHFRSCIDKNPRDDYDTGNTPCCSTFSSLISNRTRVQGDDDDDDAAAVDGGTAAACSPDVASPRTTTISLSITSSSTSMPQVVNNCHSAKRRKTFHVSPTSTSSSLRSSTSSTPRLSSSTPRSSTSMSRASSSLSASLSVTPSSSLLLTSPASSTSSWKSPASSSCSLTSPAAASSSSSLTSSSSHASGFPSEERNASGFLSEEHKGVVEDDVEAVNADDDGGVVTNLQLSLQSKGHLYPPRIFGTRELMGHTGVTPALQNLFVHSPHAPVGSSPPTPRTPVVDVPVAVDASSMLASAAVDASPTLARPVFDSPPRARPANDTSPPLTGRAIDASPRLTRSYSPPGLLTVPLSKVEAAARRTLLLQQRTTGGTIVLPTAVEAFPSSSFAASSSLGNSVPIGITTSPGSAFLSLKSLSQPGPTLPLSLSPAAPSLPSLPLSAVQAQKRHTLIPDDHLIRQLSAHHISLLHRHLRQVLPSS